MSPTPHHPATSGGGLLVSPLPPVGGVGFLAMGWIIAFALLPTIPTQLPSPRFDIATAAGQVHTGAVEHLGEDWSVRVRTAAGPVAVKGDEVVRVRRHGVLLPAHAIGPQVVFTNGDRVPLHPEAGLRLVRERLQFRPALPLSASEGRFAPPAASVALVWFAPPAGTEEPSLFLRRLLAERRAQDVVFLRDGDRIEGILTGLDEAKGCRITAGRREVDVPLARLAAVALNTDLRPRSVPDRSFARLVLDGGCRLALAAASVDVARRELTGKTLHGTAVTVPLGRVAALDLYGGAAVYLSDLTPRTYEPMPYLGVSWPLVEDGSVAGRELRLGGATYDRGLGLHAAARVTYALDGRYRRFEALVGLDDQTGKRGRACIRVLVDGKERPLPDGGKVSAAGGPLRVRADVRGARELTLVVDFGRFGDVQAHVNWADACLCR